MLLLVSALGLGAGCGSEDGDANPTPTIPTPTISVTLSQSSASAPQGGSANVGVNVIGGGGFAGGPAIAVTGLPAGVTSTVSNIQTTGSTSTSTVTLTVAPTTTPGDHAITVNVTGSGVKEVTTTFILTVTAFSFTLTRVPLTLSVPQGASETSSLTITRNNVTGTVSLAVTGAPTGVTATFTPASTTGTTATLAVTAAADATVGNATLTVTGTSTGAATQFLTVPLTVAAQPPRVALTLTPAALSLAQGGSGFATVAIARTNFTGTLTLEALSLPTGVTASIVSNPSTGTTAIVTLAANATAVLGKANVIIRATGAGIVDATVTIALTITSASSSLTVALNPASLSIARGASTVTSISIGRIDFTGAVMLSVENVPAGVTARFDLQPAMGNAGSLTLTASTTATPGTADITIRGIGTGTADATSKLQATVPDPPFAIAGFNINMYGRDLLPRTPNYSQSFDQLVSTGSNTVMVTTPYFQSTASSADVGPDSRDTETDAHLAELFDVLRGRGFTVVYKFTLIPKDGTWSGAIRPADPAAWFSAYKAHLVRLAALSEAHGVKMLYIANEMQSMAGPAYATQWNDVVDGVRGVFSGRLSWNAVLNARGFPNGEAFMIPVVSRLDHIGLSVYEPLTSKKNPSVTELTEAWYGNREGKNLVSMVKTLNQRTNKPIVFSELSYRSVDGDNIDPADWMTKPTDISDPQEQADCYEAFMRVWTKENQPWMLGVLWWQWMLERTPPIMQSQTPQNRPAQAVVTAWFTGRMK